MDPDFKALAVVVQWKENMIDSRWPEFDSISRFLKASGKGLRFTVPVALGFRERLINLTQLPPIEKFIQLLQILYELSRSTGVRALCEQDFIYNLDLNENERISKIYCYVKRHYQDKITLKDIASYVNISEEYFSRFFSKTMKKTFFAFLNEYRINIACQLLIETDMSVKEVCYHCGYESLPFFYRQFKKVKGCSPMEFRGRYV